MKVYISGPITGRENNNAAAFALAEAQLRRNGHDPVNPHVIAPESEGMEWSDYMRADIRALCRCSAVATLDGWEDSRGARLEVDIARQLGMDVQPIAWWTGIPDGPGGAL